jgi:hypothetical protein
LRPASARNVEWREDVDVTAENHANLHSIRVLR